MMQRNNVPPNMYADPYQEKVFEKWADKLHGSKSSDNDLKMNEQQVKTRGSKFSRIVKLLVKSW